MGLPRGYYCLGEMAVTQTSVEWMGAVISVACHMHGCRMEWCMVDDKEL